MDKISVNEILHAAKGRLLSGDAGTLITGVRHDSRECGAGDLFVAVCGEKNDGHDYIESVISSEAAAVMVSHEGPWLEKARAEGTAVIMVEDTVYAMGELAGYYLDKLDVRKVAVTGSVGKTSVRDMVYYILSEKYVCGRNMKNYNNDIGLPLSIFQFDSSTEAVVLEMGMSGYGEIDRLAGIVRPDIGIITNIGVAHIENLGSREGIFKAKMELAGHISESGTLIFEKSDMLTKESTAGDYRQVSAGTDKDCDYVISNIDDRGIEGIEFTLEHEGKTLDVRLPVPGKHNAVNSAVAVAAGELLDVSAEDALKGLSKLELTGRRLRYIRGRQADVIDDTYNASPDSMKSALKVLENSPLPEKSGSKRTAILGDMFELGDESRMQHREVGRFAAGLDIDRIIAVGSDAREIFEGAQGGRAEVMYFSTKEEFYARLGEFAGKGDIILVKGSRGMKMEDIVEKLIEYQEL